MTTPPNHNTADQSGADERVPTPRTDNLIMMVSADPADRDNALVDHSRKLERELISTQWDNVPDVWLKLYACVNHAMGQIGVSGQLDTRSESIDSLMNALHDIDGGIVSTRAMELFDKADMPIFHATELALRECATPTATPQPFPAPAVQSGELPAPRRYFHTLPLGTAFSYIGSDEKWIVLETHGCGLVAKYAHHDSNKPLQQICSFEDSEYAAQHTEVDVVPLEAIAQTAPSVAGEADMVELNDELWRAYAQNVISEMREIVTAGLTGEPFKAGFDSAIDEFEHRLLKTAAPTQGAKQNG